MQQQVLFEFNSDARSAAINSIKMLCYTVAVRNETKKPESISINAARTTVANKSSNR
ncbi:19784_t:CDS:2, partial [Funneliformis geosporum]